MGSTLPVVRERTSIFTATIRAEYPSEESAFAIVASSRRGSKDKWFPPLARVISRNKQAAAIHHLTDEKERTCRDWCAGAVDPPARVVIKLLHSPVGWIVFEYLMRGCEQPWWLEVQRARHCAAAYEQARGQLHFDM